MAKPNARELALVEEHSMYFDSGDSIDADNEGVAAQLLADYRDEMLTQFEDELELSPWQHDNETVREFEKLIAKLRGEP